MLKVNMFTVAYIYISLSIYIYISILLSILLSIVFQCHILFLPQPSGHCLNVTIINIILCWVLSLL